MQCGRADGRRSAQVDAGGGGVSEGIVGLFEEVRVQFIRGFFQEGERWHGNAEERRRILILLSNTVLKMEINLLSFLLTS